MTCVECGEEVGAHPPTWGDDPFAPLNTHADGHLFVTDGEPEPNTFPDADDLPDPLAGSGGWIEAGAREEAAGRTAGGRLERAALARNAAARASQDWSYVHPTLVDACRPWVENGTVYLVSGHRTWEQQDYLYQGWLARRPGFAPANPPGISNHEAQPSRDASSVPWAALAVDLGGNKERLAREAAHLLHRPALGEDWHFQLHGNPSARWQGWGDAGYPHDQPAPVPPPYVDPDPYGHDGRVTVPLGA